MFFTVAIACLLTTHSRVAVDAQNSSSGGIPEGYKLIEGDILVPEGFPGQGGGGSTFGDATFWPGGIVPYEFDGNTTAQNQTDMLAAMAEIEAVSAVQFRPKVAGDAGWLHIQDSTGNNSHVGMQGGSQIVNITSWTFVFVMVHELFHALGFWHEHSRPDRDGFLQINYANVCQDCCLGGSCDHDFDIRAAADVYGPYDFGSLMHYHQFTFSSNGMPTITVLPPNDVFWQDRIGQRTRMSTLDQLTVSFLYPEPDWRFVALDCAGGSPVGTLLDPFCDPVAANNDAPLDSTVWIEPGSYPAVGVYTRRMTLAAPLGNVVLGN